MKLASLLKTDGRDGRLVVVSRDLGRALPVPEIAPTMQAALDNWAALEPRLREAALRVTLESSKVIDVAFGSGFGDVSNFNRAFRAEFGVNPRAFRASA